MKERRRTRISTVKEATLSDSRFTVRGIIDNVSLKGCLLQVGTEEGFAEGSNIALVIHLENDNPEFDIILKADVVRREESVIALEFTEISQDSFQHLMRFVQYNSEDPETIEMELSSSAYE